MKRGIKNKRDKNQRFFQCNFFPKNRRGWIKIIEAFIAILLITGSVMLVVNQRNSEMERIEKNSEAITAILRNIELNYSLRDEILDASSVPVEWTNFDSLGLDLTRDKIESETPPGFECQAKICALNIECPLNSTIEKDVYAESVIISANPDIYNPRQLKLFCWES